MEGSGNQVADAHWSRLRKGILRNAAGIGVATGAYGLSFGAIATAAGFTLAQTAALSLLLFSGASQFALVSAAGSPVAAAATAVLLGTRNGLYGLRLAPVLHVRGLRRLIAAQLVIDESTAMSISQPTEAAGRLGFWATGVAVFALWNLATVVGALGARALSNPRALGLDVAAPAAFVALLAPRLRGREPWAVLLTAAVVALIAVPFVPAGVPILLAALTAALAGLRPIGSDAAAGPIEHTAGAAAGDRTPGPPCPDDAARGFADAGPTEDR